VVRQETIEDIQAIPEVTFDFYKDAVLPKVEDNALNTACDTLRNAGDLRDDGWCGMRFEEDDSKKTENDFYAPLAKYLQKVVDQNGPIRFSSKPDSKLESEGDHASYKADINGLVTETTAVNAD
ncbi:hypothetical protein BT96DRAFT_793155, partial [Gymnopus androsaceus JB14]